MTPDQQTRFEVLKIAAAQPSTTTPVIQTARDMLAFVLGDETPAATTKPQNDGIPGMADSELIKRLAPAQPQPAALATANEPTDHGHDSQS